MKLIVSKYCGTKERDDSLWYGGTVAEIGTDKGTYRISATGDVYCKLIAKRVLKIKGVNYQQGQIIVELKDKNESGAFEYRIGDYIENDERLYQIIQGNDQDYELELENNNKLELIFTPKYKDAKDSITLDTRSVGEAIKLVIDDIRKTMPLSENKYIIYCRLARYDDIASRIQKDLCRVNIAKDHNTSKFDVFIDNGFNGLEPLKNPALSILLEKIGEDKVIYISKSSRLSRDLIDLNEICNILKENNNDVYSVQEKQSLLSYPIIEQTFLSQQIFEKELEHE